MNAARGSLLTSREGLSGVIINDEFTSIGTSVKSKLVNYGFNENIWSQFVLLLEHETFKVDEIVKIIFNRNDISDTLVNSLVYLGAVYQPEIMKRYLIRQSKVCFSKKAIFHKNLKEYIGLDTRLSDVGYTSQNSNVKTRYSFCFLKMIDNICVEYKNNKSVSLKIYVVSVTEVEVYYKASWYTLVFGGDKKSVWKFVNCTNSVYKTIKMLKAKCNLSDIAKEFGVKHNFVVNIYKTFFPEMFFKDIVTNLDDKIHNNKILYNAWDIYVGLFSRKILVGMHSEEFVEKVEKVLAEKKIEQKNNYITTNKNILKKNSDIYVLGNIKNESFVTCTFHMSWSSLPIGKEIRTFLYFKNSSYATTKRMMLFCQVVEKLIHAYNIKSAKDINGTYLNDLFKDTKNKKEIMKVLSSFFKFLIGFDTLKLKEPVGKLPPIPKNNPAKEFRTIDNLENVEHIPPMPEVVYHKIKTYLHTLDPEIQHAFIIMSAVGCRPGELDTIEENSLVVSELDGEHYLIININKQKGAYAKKGLAARREVPIVDEEVINAFHKQEENTRGIRAKSGIQSIFVSRSGNTNKYGVYVAAHRLNRAINALIKEKNITDETGKLWKYEARQMRSWVVTTLVEGGYDNEVIRKFFGWHTADMLDKAYAIVRAKRLCELNSEFFYEHFRATIPDESLKKFSKNERKELFAQLYIHYRQMEYGKCLRHPVMGECGKLQEPKFCVSCVKLITEDVYLPKWRELRKSQQLVVDSLFTKLDKENIKKDEYMQWAEVQREIGILNAYIDLIQKLEKE